MLYDNAEEVYKVLSDFAEARQIPVHWDNLTFDAPADPSQVWLKMRTKHKSLVNETVDNSQFRRSGEFNIRIAVEANKGNRQFLDLGEEVEALYLGKTIGNIIYENVRFYEEGPGNLKTQNDNVKPYYFARVDGDFFYLFCPNP